MSGRGIAAVSALAAALLAALIFVFAVQDGDDAGDRTTTEAPTSATPPEPPDASATGVTPEAAKVIDSITPRSAPPQQPYAGAPPAGFTPEPGGGADVDVAPDGNKELVITRPDGTTSTEVEIGLDGRASEARYFDQNGDLELVISGVRPLPGNAAGAANPLIPLRVRCGSSRQRAAPWRFESFPQRWKLKVGSVPRSLMRQGALKAMRKARATWIKNRSHCRNIRDTSRVRFRYAGGTRQGVGLNGVSVVDFGNTSALGGACPGTVACALTWVSGRRVVESDIRFSTVIRGGFSVRRRSGTFDLQSVMTHEIGHSLGLEHVNSPTNVMYAFARRGDISARRLGRGDALLNNRKY